MKRAIRPASALGWLAFWLGAATVIWGILLPTLVAVWVLWLKGPTGAIRIPAGFGSAMLELLFAIGAIVAGIMALRRGERSWMTLLAFVAAIIVGGFWILFVLGEALMPH
jgi:hypothetical protein